MSINKFVIIILIFNERRPPAAPRAADRQLAQRECGAQVKTYKGRGAGLDLVRVGVLLHVECGPTLPGGSVAQILQRTVPSSLVRVDGTRPLPPKNGMACGRGGEGGGARARVGGRAHNTCATHPLPPPRNPSDRRGAHRRGSEHGVLLASRVVNPVHVEGGAHKDGRPRTVARVPLGPNGRGDDAILHKAFAITARIHRPQGTAAVLSRRKKERGRAQWTAEAAEQKAKQPTFPRVSTRETRQPAKTSTAARASSVPWIPHPHTNGVRRS